MRRREFITLVGGAAVSWPITSHAQQSDKTRLIGVLISYAESDRTSRSEVAAFRGGLAKLGWTEGSNLRIELRWGNADPDRIRTLAKELIDLRPDVILSPTTLVTGALARETRTIPMRRRSDRQRFRREPRTSGRQHHRLHGRDSRTGR